MITTLSWPRVALAVCLTALAWLAPLDQYAESQAQAGLKRALATFAVARALLLLVLVRFAVPMAALGSDLAYQLFLADRYQQSQAALSLSGDELGELAAPEPQQGPETLGGRMQRWWSEAGESLDLSARLQRLKDAATQVTEHIVELIVVFLLQTLIMPLLLLYGLWHGALALVRARGS